MNLILASQSKQRQKIMAATFSDFKIEPADIDEGAIEFKTPQEKAEKIAVAKAQVLASKNKITLPTIIIAADTFCVYQDKILEKPKDLLEARAMLELQAGNWVEAHTGYAFLYLNDGETKIESGTELVKAKFRELSKSEIDFYVENNPVLTWSAAFSAAYDSGMAIIEQLSGNLTAFTHGLPIDRVAKFVSSVNNKDHA